MESEEPMREKLLNDKNFDQKVPYDVEKIISNFEKVSSDMDRLKPYELLSGIYEFTKAFSNLSTSLSMGFSDITSKVDVWRNLFKTIYKDEEYDSIQSIMEKEIDMNIHILNGDNNSKHGHKKNTTFYLYESGTRAMLRLSWFLNFLLQTFRNMINTTDPFNKCIRSAYDTVLASHHPWLVRKGVGIALGFAGSKRGPALKAFFGKKIIYIIYR